MRDRVVQTATKLILEPIFEVDFKDCSYGFRPGRSATQALEAIRLRGSGRKGNFVLDADIRDFFGSLDREILMERVKRRVSDRRVLSLIWMWLEAGVMEDGRETKLLSGTPQGGVISPLLSNIYLSFLDERWTKQCAQFGALVRYADDFVIVCNTRADLDEAERRVKLIFKRLRLELHPDKTRKVELSRRQARLRLPRLSPAQAHVGQDLGEGTQARVLPPALAVDDEREAGEAAREGANARSLRVIVICARRSRRSTR